MINNIEVLILLGSTLFIALESGLSFQFWQSSVTPSDKIHQSQIDFEDKLTSLKNDANYCNQNEIRRDQAEKEMQAFVYSGNSVYGWRGFVKIAENTILNGKGIKLK
jgi:hypothetical protein